MPALVRLYIRQTLVGFVVSAVFVGLLFWFNVANLWHLVTHTSEGWLAAFLLFMFNGIVFSGVQFGIAIMRMAEQDDDDPFGGKRLRNAIAPAEATVPVPVRVETPRGQAFGAEGDK
jgi:hypothetical protein